MYLILSILVMLNCLCSLTRTITYYVCESYLSGSVGITALRADRLRHGSLGKGRGPCVL